MTNPKAEVLPAKAEQHVITPMQMLETAVNQGADLDKLEKLMALQERWEANEARKAYVAALTAFKKNPPSIVKDKSVEFTTDKGTTKFDHATLNNVVKSIIPALATHGLTHSWSTGRGENGITVTCKLVHEMGHGDEVTLSAPADTSGGKNNIQAIASSVSYLERYTLLAITGLATDDMDDDAKTADPAKMTPVERQKAGMWQGPLKVTALKNKIKDIHTALRGDRTVPHAQTVIDENAEVLAQCKADLPEWYEGAGDVTGVTTAIRRFLPDYDLPPSYEHVDKHGEHVTTYHDALQYVQAVYSDASATKAAAEMVALYEHNEDALTRASLELTPEDTTQYYTPILDGYRNSKG